MKLKMDIINGTIGAMMMDKKVKELKMTLSKIYDMGLIKDNTEIFIRADLKLIAHGSWYQDDILDYRNKELESFVWQEDNKIYLDMKATD